MADIKKSVNLLPEYLRTDKNSKFLSSTIDQFIQTPQVERIDGFVGSKITPNYNHTTDFYLDELSSLRNNYSFEPALIFKDANSNITDVVAYDDIINEIGVQGGKNTNINKVFNSKFYSYDPLIDWDKLVNYTDYYWLPLGPGLIILSTTETVSNIVGNTSYTMSNGYKLSNGMKIQVAGTVYMVEGVGSSIKLIDFSLLTSYDTLATVFNEMFDSNAFDDYPFDGDKKLPLTPDYITINRASTDLNPWSRYNRWVHKEVIKISCDVNKIPTIYPLSARARRPIIEFKPNIQLYNFGKYGIKNVDLIDNTTTDAFKDVDGTYGYYVDGVLLEKGHRVIFNADSDINVRGQIYEVDFNILGEVPILRLKLGSTEVVNQYAITAMKMVVGLLPEDLAYDLNGDGSVTLADAIAYEKIAVGLPMGFTPSETSNYSDLLDKIRPLANPVNLDSIGINLGTSYYGTSWHFHAAENKWLYSQQHIKINEPPLFDLFTNDSTSYTEIDNSNNFLGNQIFGYATGAGANDSVLGFPLKYQNSGGTGSYLFNNYFLTGTISVISNNVSNNVSTAVTFLKLDNQLVNVWAESVDYKIPILEIQTITQSTSSLTLTCLDLPIDTSLSVSVYVNNIKIPTTISATSAKVTLSTTSTFSVNDVVLLKTLTDQLPNSNGYYETPMGLTNNPLNGISTELTLSELGDHLSTMVDKTTAYTGNNLRDLTDYAKYGTRIIVNANPISFAQLFLGKKEHNVVDAIRQAADHYNQFKMNFLRSIVNIDSRMSPADAVDLVLKDINKNKDITSLYQKSDMLGYGQNKTVRNVTVTNIGNVEYPIGVEFDLTRLSFQSVIIYLNAVQLIHNRDYTFDYINGTVTLLIGLAVNDIVSIHCYADTTGAYIPPTPSKLGLYPAYKPELSSYSSYVTPISFIRGHDGSFMKAYGDYRDAIILEYETRIYNNIKVLYNAEIFDIVAVRPGAFRELPYNLEDLNKILTNDFSKWAGLNNVDVVSNNTFDAGNPFTWNYTGSVDTVFGKEVSGTWKQLYRYFYDTVFPNTRPWEMLGLSEEPVWWVSQYGPAPYTSQNLNLWIDLENGYNAGTDTVNPLYARPGLSEIVPVDTQGILRSPSEFLVSANSYQDKQANWKPGDWSPAETAWKQSSYGSFVVCASAALLDPTAFCAYLYDVSRTAINATGQITYKNDDLYLSPKKLLIDDEDKNQIAGFGVYVAEQGKQKNRNYLSTLRQDLDYLDVNLFHKLGGFVSKDKLQIIIDSIDPTSTSPGVILPSEDYSLILNVSNPIKTARISGVIVQRSNGNFVIKGYDVVNPYFEILRPISAMSSGVVKVGGVSEEFSEWSNIVNNGNSGVSTVDATSAESVTGRYYKQGQLVRYNNKFYRVKIGHNATATFDANLFQGIPSLPMKGGASAQLPSRFASSVTQIPYGSTFTSVQEVYDVILGYGAYLETQGFIFDEFSSDLNEILNWKFTGKEFLYWSTQNWADDNLITLSPFSNQLKYNFPNSVVDNISTGKYEYSLLKADGKSYPIDKFTMARDDTVCTIKTTDHNEGLFFATLNSVQKEHAMVLNNFTMFNDTIYDITTGYKQRRIKLSGFRTKNWNGDLFSPGFVFDNVEITDWQAYKNYLPGKVVRYNGRYYESLVKINSSATFDFTKWDQLRDKPVSKLLPNFDYKINQFEDFYSLDIDNFDFGQQQLAQHLTGYTARTYLNNIFTNPISQYKFYQGMIKDKGTKNAFDKLSKASEYSNKGEISFQEEWAFRVGHYGSFETLNEIEFPLTEGTYLENPYVVKFVNTAPTDPNPLINYITSSTLLLTPVDYVPASTVGSYPGTWLDNNLKLTTAGYVRPDDVTSTAYNKNSLLDIANNSVIQNGDTIWLGFQESGNWTVYRYTKQLAEVSGVFVSAPGSEITFVTDGHHNLQPGDIISVVRFNEQVNGVYIVNSIVTISQFTVSSSLSSIENAELLNYGSLYKFEEARYNDLDDLAQVTDLLKLNAGDKVWIDQGTDSKWKVYEKVKNYLSTVVDTVDTPAGQQFGTSIFAADDSPVVLVSAPGWRISGTVGWGRVKVFNKVNNAWSRKYDYILNSSQKTYCSPTSSTQFGYALQYDIAKKLYVTGAPEATYVRATGTNVLTFSTGSGYARPYIKEGLVKIDSRQEDFPVFTEIVLVNPRPVNNSRFGHSICVSQVESTTATTMLVGAPGSTGFAGTGSVYAYSITTSSTVTSHVHGIDLTTSTINTVGDQWGYKIAGCSIGFAISAPGYSTSTGIVHLFNPDLSYSQPINSPFGVGGRFGHDIAISSTGTYLLISAPEIKGINEPYGKVAIYENDVGIYRLLQVINNPLSTNDLKFGYSISISKDEKTIAIGALGKTRSREQIFDANNNLGKTTFDSDSTKFTESIPDAGTVYVYNKIGNKFIQADELNDVNILSGSRYGSAVVATNNNVFVGAPSNQSNTLSTTDTSNLYIFGKKDTTIQSWRVLREQEDTVNVSIVGRVALIDTLKEEIVDYLDVIDPVKGKIAGIAEQELKFKAAFDPATYSIGLAGTIVNTETNWLDEHVGELWWDLSTAKYTWYEQGDEIFRKNNWGRLFPGASIDVYEWVKSDLLPSEWAAQADTTKGLVNSISGQPKYPDNSVISVKQVFNNVTGSFENVYYFWVKNKVTLPDVKNRRLSGYQVASYIADPVANGLKFIEILSPSAVAFANVQPLLVGNRINANITTDYNSSIPKHTEWLLLTENDQSSVPNTLLEKKLFDSLLGHDSLGTVVPSKTLTYRNRYGIGIRPQQTLFKDRLSALRNLVSFVNSVLLKNRIVGSYSFENLDKKEEIPALFSYEYDKIVEDTTALAGVVIINYAQAELECYANNGKIKSVVITNPGFGYTNPPKVTIDGSGTDCEIVTALDVDGRVISATIINPGNGYADGYVRATARAHTVIVQVNSDYNGRWTKHSFNYILRTWVKVQTQKYNTSLYWTTVDWVGTDYNSFKTISYTISDLSELGLLTDIVEGDYIKVKNIGDGKYAILQNVSSIGNYIPSYNIVYRENGTIQLSDMLWDYSSGNYAYDTASIEETLYDQIPDQELYYILIALKNNIFINSLKVNWNLFFFTAVKYALTEQKLLDWAFKTSFINVLNNIGTLDQRPVYKLNNEEYFENYINEVKPYHTKIRSYTSIYDKLEQSNLYTTDFDLPSYYNTATDTISPVTSANTSTLSQYPWKSWADNYKLYVGAIEVGYSGSGYTQQPTVTITTAIGDTGSGATAEAYISNGAVYRVIVTNPGSGYIVPPIVTISDSDVGNDTARVSVVMANDNVRKNIIGMKFDRTSTVGDLVDLTVTDEFICDGTVDKFTLTWLASPDKTTITPLLDGKLVFGADYIIEYFQVKVSHTGVDIPQAFPRNSWDGATWISRRYGYFINTDNSETPPGSIRHYAKFVFLNQVPSYGQVFKITYTKNIDLYNAVDRINSLYNPTDIMPGKELPLLISGAEYPGTSVQGLLFNQTPNWDNTGTQYDAAPWGDSVSNYVVTTLTDTLYEGFHNILVPVGSASDIVPGMSISVVGGSRPFFRKNTVVTDVNNNNITIETLDIVDTKIKHIYSTGTAVGSTIKIDTVDSFHNAVSVGDFIQISNVGSLHGYGVQNIGIASTISTTGTVSITISAPTATQGGIQAIFTPVLSGNTVTSFIQVVAGMGYLTPPTVTINHDANVISTGTAQAYLDPGFNVFSTVTNCTDTTVEVRSLYTLSSTATTLSYYSNFRLSSLLHSVEGASKLLDYISTITFTNVTTASIQTFAPFNDAVRASVLLSTTSTEIVSASKSTYPIIPHPNPIVYTISNSTDGLNRAIVSISDVTGQTISGDIEVRVYGATELEFYTPNTNYNNLDVAISGSSINDTSLGFNPADLVIDGNNFLNPVDSYAPEECVPGHVSDAIGIDVYTTAAPSYPTVVTGAFGAGTSDKTYAKLPWFPNDPVGFRVQADGKTYDRVDTESSFSALNDIAIASTNTSSTYFHAFSIYRTDFLIRTSTYDAFNTPLLAGDIIRNYQYLESDRIITTVTRDVATVSGISYTRIIMNAPASATSPGGVPIAVTFPKVAQYCIFDGTIIVPKQSSNTRIGYSFVTVGSDAIVDSNFVSANVTTVGNTGTMSAASLLSIDDVQSVYVLLNGREISEGSSPYYVLGPYSSVNNRATVTVKELSSNIYNLEVWFFDHAYPKFNRVHEQFYTVGSTATSSLILDRAPGTIEPLSEQVIVEKITPSSRERMLPPWASYYKVQNGKTEYDIDSKNPENNGRYTLDNVKVYLNGIELRPGYDFSVATSSITLLKPGIVAGDAIAITPLVDYEYIVLGSTLNFTSAVTSATIKVTSFTDHDNMMMRTEKFKGNDSLRLTFPVINENYVWVTLNDMPLTAGYDYMVLEDLQTIEFSEFVNYKPTDDIVVVVINPPSYGSTVLGYRIFKDMFDRQHFKRLSGYFSTRLSQPLQYIDSQIFLVDGDHLLQPNPARNLPGVVLIDSERIEYTAKDGNVLSGLRRGTLGTGPAKFSDTNTKVIDQSIRQSISTNDYSLIQHIPSSNTNTYVISISSGTTTFSVNTTTHAGKGITFSTLTNSIDQVEVYYGGRRLRKTSLMMHDKSRSYYTTSSVQVNGVTTSSYEILPPEFTITTSTRQLTLNIAEEITTGTRITIVKREGEFWTDTSSTSLLVSTGTQATFLRNRPAELPDIYFYGGDKILLENSNALTDENGEPFEGY